MKSPFRCLLVIVTASLIFGICPDEIGAAESSPDCDTVSASPVSSEAVSWKALASSGAVEARLAVDTESAWGRVSRGDELEPRTLVRTGRRGRATLAQCASVLMVDPESQVELPSFVSPDGVSSVIQNSGSVVYEVDGEKTDGFKVVTPYLVAGVKGTVFLVSVTDQGASVTVERGTVEVTSTLTGESSDIRAGETVLIDSAEQEGMEILSMDEDRRKVEKKTRKFIRAENRRLARIVNDSSVAVSGVSIDDTTGVGASTGRDLLGSDDATAAGATVDPADATEPTGAVNEWTEDENHREAERRAKEQATPADANPN